MKKFKSVTKLGWVAIFCLWGIWKLNPFSTINDQDTEVVIEKGQGAFKIASTLAQAKILDHPFGFLLRVFLSGETKSIQAGEYLVSKHMSFGQLISKMRKGDVIQRTITVIEGETVASVITKLNKNTLLKGEIRRIPKEGLLLPATYSYHRNTLRQVLLDEMEKKMMEMLKALWNKRDPHVPLASMDEALTLASIVEKESSRMENCEKARIAGVFFNRISQKMRLQSDPTVIYGLTQGKSALGRLLTRQDLQDPSPYNTYRHAGLPPGPIGCPGERAIFCVLHPQHHDELYFVADGTGGHVFSKTLNEHNQQVQKWRALKKQKRLSGNDE